MCVIICYFNIDKREGDIIINHFKCFCLVIHWKKNVPVSNDHCYAAFIRRLETCIPGEQLVSGYMLTDMSPDTSCSFGIHVDSR